VNSDLGAAVAKKTPYEWTPKKSAVAISLAQGYSQQAVADEHSIAKRTVQRWVSDTEFAEEVDRLSLMVDIASRAARLRIVMRVARQKIDETGIETEKDLLDWLKFAQSETDGVKLDIAKLLAAFGSDEPSVAGGGSDSSPKA